MTEIPASSGNPASWRTPEFLRDNGMISIGAEFAYAAGYAGGGDEHRHRRLGLLRRAHAGARQPRRRTTRSEIAIFSVEAQGGDDRPHARVLRPSVQRQPRHARQRDRRCKPRRRRRDAARPGPRPTCTASRSTATSTSATRTRRTACSTASCRRPRPLAQTPDNAYLAQRLPSRERRADGERQADQAHHQQLGQPAHHRELQHLRHAARRPGELRPERGVAATCPRRTASPTPNGNTVHWLNGAIEVARTGTILQFTAGNGGYDEPDAARRRAVLPARAGGPLVHDVRHQPRDRAHVQPRRLGPGPRAADVQPVRRREVVVRDRPGQRDQQHDRCRSSTACRSRATGARRARRWPARTRRPRWR